MHARLKSAGTLPAFRTASSVPNQSRSACAGREESTHRRPAQERGNVTRILGGEVCSQSPPRSART
eukprot:1733055-Alexandrium_andersonii.AAC.1